MFIVVCALLLRSIESWRSSHVYKPHWEAQPTVKADALFPFVNSPCHSNSRHCEFLIFLTEIVSHQPGGIEPGTLASNASITVRAKFFKFVNSCYRSWACDNKLYFFVKKVCEQGERVNASETQCRSTLKPRLYVKPLRTPITAIALLCNVLHSKPSLIFFFLNVFASIWRFSTLVDDYFKVYFDLKTIFFFAKDGLIPSWLRPFTLISQIPVKINYFSNQSVNLTLA